MAYAVPTAKTLLASAARGASADTDDQTNLGALGLHLVIDVTAASGTAPTLVVTLQGKDRTSGKYYTLLASASITGAGTTVLRLYPALTAAANLVANDVLPECWRVSTVVGGTTPSFTYSVGVSLVP